MSYLVFARKFRPQRFENIIGQEHVTATLQNAIKEKKIAQSFLFSGTRGVGKTSAARILAKSLNCEKGIEPEPCGKCVSCKEITLGNSLDVLEVDGASNRGIDEIRNLRENVKFKPAHSRFKVYIIDEVHMLTAEAFNALLKTLEEPPDHVKFIFATTELHKVPLTILSRCQKFAFRKVPVARISEKLSAIAAEEKLSIDEKSLFVISKVAEGSLRDAESLLDQAASFSKGKITYAKVLEAFGISSEEVYLALLDALIAKDAKWTIEIFAPITAEGRDMVQFVRGLTEIFRALLVMKVAGAAVRQTPGLVDFAPETLRELELRNEKFSKEDLLSVVYSLQNLLRDVRRSVLPELQVEATLIKLAIREDLTPLSEILQKLNSAPARAARPGLPDRAAANPVLPKTVPPPARETSAATPATTASVQEPKDSGTPENSATPGLPDQPARQGQPEQAADSSMPKLAQEESIGLNEVERVWAEVIERVKAQKMSCGMFLSEAAPVEVEGNLIVLGLPTELKFHKESLEKPDNKKLVEEVFQTVLAAKVRVSFVITTPEKAVFNKPAFSAETEKIPDIVESALKIFDGHIINKK